MADSDIPDLVEELPEDTSHLVAHNVDLSATYDEPSSTPKAVSKKVPISIITGYLGSGKSTLLQQIGRKTKKRLAIILNEFGDSASIEKAVTIEDTQKNEAVQEWLDLGNGCLCCTVKDNGVAAIEQLIDKSKDKIDYILLETTGIADPAPIARMFWLDEGLASNVYIDGVITVVDSQNIVTCLEDVGGHWHRQQQIENVQDGLTTAHLQIALADTVIINKVDLAAKNQIDVISSKIRSINSTCPVYTSSYGDIDMEKILDLHAFDADSQKVQQSLAHVTDAAFHDDRIATVSVTFPFFTSEQQFDDIERFIQYVLWEHTVNGKEVEVHRLKGILVRSDTKDVRVVQGVRETYDIVSGGVLLEDITENKLVFIGKNLNQADLVHDLQSYIA